MEKYQVLSAVFNITPENTFVKSTDFIYIASSESFAKSVGKMSAAEVIGKTDYELFEYSLAEKHREEDMELLKNGSIKENILEEFQSADGQIRYDSISKYCAWGICCAHILLSAGGNKPSDVIEITMLLALICASAFATPPRLRPTF